MEWRKYKSKLVSETAQNIFSLMCIIFSDKYHRQFVQKLKFMRNSTTTFLKCPQLEQEKYNRRR